MRKSGSTSKQEQWPALEAFVPHGRTWAKNLTPEVVHSICLTEKKHAEVSRGDMNLLLPRFYTSGAIITAILAFQQVMEIHFLLVWACSLLRMRGIQQ